MSILSKIENGLGLASKMAELVSEMVGDNATDEEILKRIAKPGGVAQELINAVRSRKIKLNDFVTNG